MLSPHQMFGDPCQSQGGQEEYQNEGQKGQIIHAAPSFNPTAFILAANPSKRSQESRLGCQESVKITARTRSIGLKYECDQD